MRAKVAREDVSTCADGLQCTYIFDARQTVYGIYFEPVLKRSARPKKTAARLRRSRAGAVLNLLNLHQA